MTALWLVRPVAQGPWPSMLVNLTLFWRDLHSFTSHMSYMCSPEKWGWGFSVINWSCLPLNHPFKALLLHWALLTTLPPTPPQPTGQGRPLTDLETAQVKTAPCVSAPRWSDRLAGAEQSPHSCTRYFLREERMWKHRTNARWKTKNQRLVSCLAGSSAGQHLGTRAWHDTNRC